MPVSHQLYLAVPPDWSNEQKGDFFEKFVSELLAPIRFRVVQRLRFTGMEIDLLAEGLDHRRKLLVECKAQRDPLPADVITKLLGNVQVRRADAGWLFSISDLSKDGRGLWHEMQNDTELSAKFAWYPPNKICEILISQRAVVGPDGIDLGTRESSTATLCVTPHRRTWFFEILKDGIPASFVAFDAVDGRPLGKDEAALQGSSVPGLGSLSAEDATTQAAPAAPIAERGGHSPAARVAPGDSWEDPRPARPIDFVGRDEVIDSVFEFFGRVQARGTQTRNFAIQGPSGWGKSSLVLKLADLAKDSRIQRCSVTAVDTRSAVNPSFVSEALRAAFSDAATAGLLVPGVPVQISSITHPLGSPSVEEALSTLARNDALVVLIFDQFEELFSKEPLFDIFELIRDLSLQIDALQAPLVLGFAWKTDVVLPQQHPAYYLWHELTDRRALFPVREFGTADIKRVLSKAEAAFGASLTPALKSRLIEQCQGFPWLLKKLVVHILRRLPEVESQYALLERELDLQLLFQEDLAALTEEQVRCLKHVAANSPASVPEVETNFSREATNSLTHQHLLVRSGMNYVVYWDIFRDYLTDGRVPRIPWARTFQRDPSAAMRLLKSMTDLGCPASSSEFGRRIGLQEGTAQNLLADLVALQMVDRVPGDLYQVAPHLRDTSPLNIARFAQRQLERHVAYGSLVKQFEKGLTLTGDQWDSLFAESHPNYRSFTDRTLKQYANTLRAWFLFAGLLENAGGLLRRPVLDGAQRGILRAGRNSSSTFLGASTPATLVRLLAKVGSAPSGVHQDRLLAEGLRNAVLDAATLGLVTRDSSGTVRLASGISPPGAEAAARAAILEQPTVIALKRVVRPDMTDREAGITLREALGVDWKDTSAQRNASGLRRFSDWAEGRFQIAVTGRSRRSRGAN